MLKNEEEILKYWKKIGVVSKVQKLGKKRFVFYEGPPTANGKPGLHHVLARVFKDVVIRYKTMKGFKVARRAGWDTHGLPVELEVEKKLGISGKKEIENIVKGDRRRSIIEFNKLCKESVWKYKEAWEKNTEKIGFWLDLKNPYITYESSYIEKLWSVIAEIYRKGLLVKDRKIVPYCPRCETPLSSHELAQGYKDVEDPSFTFLLELLGKREYLAVWTTTPWTLPANLAVAVDAAADYGLYLLENGKKAWFAVERAAAYRLEKPLRRIKGSFLVGKKYKPLFTLKAANKNSYKVYKSSVVTLEEGTGILHIAPGFGVDDFNFGVQNKIPPVVTVDGKGAMKEGFPGAGLFVKKADKEIVESLKSRGAAYRNEKIVHTYPFCWRCDTPIIYMARDSWFVKVSQIRQKLLLENSKINWIPKHLKAGRFGNWLKEAKDWAFSRERYWGTPLPVWVCKDVDKASKTSNNSCGNIEIISSLASLNSKLPKSRRLTANSDLHRPYIDEVVWSCPKCKKGKMVREPYVCDVWFDSGAMPFASGEYSAARYPADYICEAVDQTRGWFYTLLTVGVLMDKGTPYKNVISLGHILDSHGKKMSKSKGNVINPDEVLNKYGADSLRMHLFTLNRPGDYKIFDLKDMAVTHRKTVLLLKNVLNFLATYSRADGVDLSSVRRLKVKKRVLDSWLDSLTHKLADDVSKAMDAYDILTASRLLVKYIDELSTWYLRRSRKERSRSFYRSLSANLVNFSRIAAPFMPFISESIFRYLEPGFKSVHFESFPKKSYDQKILERMENLREIARIAHAKRAENGVKVRQPLAALTIGKNNFSKEELELLRKELNVKAIKVSENLKEKCLLDTSLTPELKKEGRVNELIRLIQETRKKAGYRFDETVSANISCEIELSAALKERIKKETYTIVVAGRLSKIDAESQKGSVVVKVGR